MIIPPRITVGNPVTVKTIVTMTPVAIGAGTNSGVTTSSLWTGQGEPHLVVGARVGDEYLDTITGMLYRLDPGE